MQIHLTRLVLGLGLCLLAPAALAEVSQQGGQRIEAAYAELASLLAQKQAKGDVPRLSNPGDAKVLDAFFDSAERLGRPPFMARDLPMLTELLDKQRGILRVYVAFAASSGGSTSPGGMAFQGEIIRLMAAIFATFGAALPAVDDFMGKLKPEEINGARRQGLRQLRLGLRQFVEGAAMALRTPGLTPENLMRLTESLSQYAPAVAKASTRVDRAAMLASMQASLRLLSGNAQATLKEFVTAMSGTACEGLCKLE